MSIWKLLLSWIGLRTNCHPQSHKNIQLRLHASRIAQSEGRPEREIVKQLLIVGLHNMYVDGLWIQKDNLNKPKHFQDLLELIAKDTGIPIALEGVISGSSFSLPDKIPVELFAIVI